MPSFRLYEPDQHLLLPPSLRDWLTPDHLVWFISESVDQLDLSEIVDSYREGGQGNLPYHPAMMLKVLIYAYATGTFSSRGIARQIEENIAFRVLAAGNAPDHRTICRFREQHLNAFERLFVQVVQIAQGAGLVKLGTLAVDGSKIRANASKRKAMSYERMQQEEKRLKKEIRALTKSASKRDADEDVQFGPDFRGDELPAELKRREDRLAKIRAAARRLEERKRREADEKSKDRDDDRSPRGGQRRKHPVGKPKPKDQENFTDPESRIMKDGRGAFEQCFNAGIAVDDRHRLIVANTVQQSAADARTLIPLIDQTKKNTRRRVQSVLADAGYASEANLRALERRKITGYVALGREGNSKTPKPKSTATAKQRMASRLKSKRGRAKYKRRKHIAEPPFGWVKRGLGFRQFSLRGLSKVAGEFNLVCLALDLRRMHHLMRWT